jgi:hypothetical protein
MTPTPSLSLQTTVIGLITDNDETAYTEEVRDLAGWCQNNNISINVTKTKEMIVDYRKRRTEHAPILIDVAVVEQVESFKFLGVQITNKLEWSKHTKTVTTKPFPLRKLKDLAWVLRSSKGCNIESILTGCITAWYGNCSASDHKALERVLHTAQYITGAKLPAIQDIYTRRCQRKALKIVKDHTPVIDSLLPHGKRYRRAKSRTKMLLNSFYHQAIRLLKR